MRRQHGERRLGRLEQQHQGIVERRVLLARARHPPLVAVAQRRLVAVVAIGDDQGAGARARAQARTRTIGLARVGDDPQPVLDTVVVDHVDRRRDLGRRIEHRGALAGAIVVQRHDRRRVHARRTEQPVAVLLRAGHRPLMRQDPGPERFEAHDREEPALGPLARRCRGRDTSARTGRPTTVGPCGASRRSATRPAFARPGDIVRRARHRPRSWAGPGGRRSWITRQEPGMPLGVDDVVRRRDDPSRIRHDVRVVPERAEWADLGHGSPRGAAGRHATPPAGDDGTMVGRNPEGRRATCGRGHRTIAAPGARPGGLARTHARAGVPVQLFVGVARR